MKIARYIVIAAACVSYPALVQAQVSAGQAQPDPAASQVDPAAQVVETPPVDPTGAVQAANAPAPEQSGSGDIIVTGSRTVRDGSRAPTPVTAVSSATLLQTAPTSLPDALNKLPEFTGSSGQNSGRTQNAGSTPLGNYLNLRGLGSQRLLVLLDGNRVPPTTNTNAVDVNVLPQALVARVDVVTGGASAVYGSDAVTGVVNFVLDEKFTGLKLTAQSGVSTYGDAGSYRVGAAFGTKIGERIHLIGSYEHYNNDGVPRLYDRNWAVDAPSTLGAGTTTVPLTIVPNATRNTLTDGGLVLGGALAAGSPTGVQFTPNGTLVPFNPGQPALTANGVNIATNTSIGGDGGVWGEPRNGGTSIAGSLRTNQAFAHATFDATDSVQVFAQGIYADSSTSFAAPPNNHVYGAGGGSRRTTIFADNPYLRPEYAAALTAAGQSSFDIGRIFNDVPLIQNRSRTEFWSAQAGIKGDLGSSWKWDVNYVYGRAEYESRFNEFDSRRFFAAVDAVRDPATGNIVCGVTLRNPSLLPGCVPMNILGDGNITQEAFNYVRQDSVFRIVNTMQYVNANVSGNLFHLPAGDVALAVGAEYRKQTLRQTSNSNPATFAGADGAARFASYFEGIRGVPSTALLFDSINVGLASGEQTIKEAYGELTVPILKDTFLAEELSLNVAGRYTDYKTSGGVTTWKVGASWAPIEGIRFRANQSRDIAAPSLYNLYAGENLVFGQASDPLTGVTQVALQSQSGNIDLKPEKGDTTTLGVVLQPRFIPRLTLSIDAYRVSIKDAIGTQSIADELADCQSSGGTAPVCDLIERPFPFSNTSPANFPTKIRVIPQNLAQLETKGIDFEVSYRLPLDQIAPSLGGDLTLRAFANYLDTYNTRGAGNQPTLQRAGRVSADFEAFGLPRWKGLLSQTYARGGFTLALFERFTGSYTLGSPNQVYAQPIKAPNVTYVDLNVSQQIGDSGRMEVFFNAQNLFDVDPPVLDNVLITNLQVPTDKTTYDVIGRYLTVGARLKF